MSCFDTFTKQYGPRTPVLREQGALLRLTRLQEVIEERKPLMLATGNRDGTLAKDRKVVDVDMAMLDLDDFSCIPD